MTATKTSLKGAPIVDFTREPFGEKFTALVRGASKPQVVIVIDRAVGAYPAQPVVVRDHLNLTGSSPLCGPNDPCGERFPVVQGIYIEDQLPALPRVVVAGLKSGVRPDADEQQLIRSLGAEACCYNLVPAMLIAAHAKCQVLGILLPENGTLPDALAAEIGKLTGEKA